MLNILTEFDTMFGSIAYRNKFITVEQLQEGVLAVQQTPGLRLGAFFLQKSYLTEAQVDVILEMQNAQRDILEAQKAAAPETPPIPVPRQPEPPKSAIDSSIFTLPGAPAPAPPAAPPKPPKPPLGIGVTEPETKPVAKPAPSAQPAPPPAPEVKPKALALPECLESLPDYLTYARVSGASDLHISAEVKPFLRLHGSILPIQVPRMTSQDTERLLFSMLDNSQKAHLLEKRSLEFCLELPGGSRFRTSMYKQRCGWDGAFHIIREAVPSFEELGLPDCLRRLTEFNQGLVLVTGPGNAGKTTTLAALLDVVNRTRTDHIITVEKPVEYIHQSIECQVTQRNVGIHTKSFAAALRAALREDPDIIMVGELRDLETLSIAITASETGHLVFGTLPTTSAVNTVSRIVDGFPVGQQAQIRMMLSESLRGVISQQLLPRKDGSGVALVLEILFITSAVSALIRDNQPHQIQSVIQTSRKMGMCRFDDSLMELAQKGIISGPEAYRRAGNKAAFEQFKTQE